VTSGLRLWTAAETTRGMRKTEIASLAKVVLGLVRGDDPERPDRRWPGCARHSRCREAVQGVARRDADARSATPLSPLCDPNPGIAVVASRLDLPASDCADDRIARDEARWVGRRRGHGSLQVEVDAAQAVGVRHGDRAIGERGRPGT